MKILLITSAYLPTMNGVTVHVENLYTSMTNNGHEVTILCPRNKNRTSSENIVPLTSIFNPFNSDYPLPLNFHVPKKIKETAFDVIHLHHPFGVRKIAEKIAKEKNIPIVFTNHTQYLQYADYYLPLIKNIVKKHIKSALKNLYKKSAFVLCSTKDTENFVKNIYSKAKTRVIPVPFNDQILTKNNSELDIRQKYNLQKNELIYLYIGRIAQEKNINLLIEAYNEATGPRVKLIIGGNGDILDSLKTQNPNIIFTGRIEREDIYSYYHQADLFVSASTSETLGLVFAEAAHCGTPLLGIDSPGVRDIIKNDLNGWLAKDTKEFKKLFSEIATNKNLKEYRKNCRESVENFSLTHNIDELEKIYKSVADKNAVG